MPVKKERAAINRLAKYVGNSRDHQPTPVGQPKWGWLTGAIASRWPGANEQP